jgi:hypothetical protein
LRVCGDSPDYAEAADRLFWGGRENLPAVSDELGLWFIGRRSGKRQNSAPAGATKVADGIVSIPDTEPHQLS